MQPRAFGKRRRRAGFRKAGARGRQAAQDREMTRHGQSAEFPQVVTFFLLNAARLTEKENNRSVWHRRRPTAVRRREGRDGAWKVRFGREVGEVPRRAAWDAEGRDGSPAQTLPRLVCRVTIGSETKLECLR